MRPSLALMKRSAWKGPFFVAFPSLQAAITNNVPIYTKARASTILPNHVGIMFHVHNGKEYIPLRVTEEMVGHKLGEFSATRKRFTYKPSRNR